jgi:hypothetical protein
MTLFRSEIAMNFRFKRLSLFVAIFVVCVSTAMAASTCPSATTYASYDPNPPGTGPSITCVTDNLQFSLFGFTSSALGGAVTPTPGSVAVTVEDPAVNPLLDGAGFSYNPGMSVSAGQEQDVAISFEVTALSGSITDLFIHFNGSVSSPTGGASTNYSETYCTSLDTNCNTFQVSDPPANLSQLITIPATTTLFITKDFTVSGGTNGSAGISQVVNEFSTSTVPEPREIGLLGLAMIGLVLAHRRIKASVN